MFLELPVERLRSAVFAPDPMIFAGVVAFLREERLIRVIGADQLAHADVAVVFAATADDRMISTLMHVTRESTARIVLVVGQVTEAALARIADTRVVRIIDRTTVTSTDLTEAVIDAREAPDVLRERELEDRLRHLRSQHVVVSDDTLPGSGMSQREIDVLSLIADGFDTAEVADRLCFSVRTVKNTVQQLLSRLRLSNRAHAVAYAVRVGAI
jgi:DNA-binding NarL/FixJ family response regulator